MVVWRVDDDDDDKETKIKPTAINQDLSFYCNPKL